MRRPLAVLVLLVVSATSWADDLPTVPVPPPFPVGPLVAESVAPPLAEFAPFAVASPDLSGGRWSGYWISDKNGHHGPLHATFTRVSDTCYRVRFTGRFWKVFPFIYGVNLGVTGHARDAVILSGVTQLGPVFGSFRYDATATATRFEARFTSKGDCGKFVLCRTCP